MNCWRMIDCAGGIAGAGGIADSLSLDANSILVHQRAFGEFQQPLGRAGKLIMCICDDSNLSTSLAKAKATADDYVISEAAMDDYMIDRPTGRGYVFRKATGGGYVLLKVVADYIVRSQDWVTKMERQLNELLDQQSKPDTLVTPFLQSIAKLATLGKLDEAIDEVIDFFEDRFHQGDTGLAVCDATLGTASVSEINSPDVLLAMLSMTLVEKERIQSRRRFYRRVKRHLQRIYANAEVANLLKGLE
jgi:hypothetical protein